MICVYGDSRLWGTPLMGTRSVAALLAANAEEYLCRCRLFTRPFSPRQRRMLTGVRFCKLWCPGIRFSLLAW